MRTRSPLLLAFSLSLSLLGTGTALAEKVTDTTRTNTGQNPKTYNTTVLILGAGMTGVTAARSLANELNITDFLILEARNEIGGRMQNTKIGSTTIEFGANWIQSLGTNPIWALAQKYNVKNTPSIWGDIDYFTGEGWEGPGGKLQEAMDRYEGEVYHKAAIEAGRREQLGLPDLSMRAGLRLAGWTPLTPEEFTAEYFYHDWEMAETPVESSFIETVNSHNETFIESGSDENNLCVDPRGFKQIIVGQAAEIDGFEDKLHLDEVVETIEYNGQGVTVKTKTGTTVHAEYALCTFSLGVLQHDDVKFDPPLPEWKQEAYAQGHMSTYTKIFARFPHKFWNSTQFTVYSDPDERGYWPVWQSLDEEGFAPGSRVYFATLTSDQAFRAEKKIDAEVQAEFMSVLRHMYGPDIPDPIEFKFPRWTLDPLFRGSFSAWGAGVTRKQQDDMREAIGGSSNSDLEKRLFFAGEHTSRNWFGYLQGAYWEGRMAAHNLADCLLRECVEQPSTAFVKRWAMESQEGKDGPGLQRRRRMWA